MSDSYRSSMPTRDGLETWQEWMEPQLPAASEDTGERPLEDDTSEWGPFFWCRATPPRHAWPVTPAWVREIGGKFRFGWGIRFRGLHHTHNFGIWWGDKAPRIDYSPLIADPNDDEEDWVLPKIEDRKSKRMPWSSVIRDRNLRRPGQNLAQFLYYQFKARRLAKWHEKQRQAEEDRVRAWADHIDDYSYSVGDSAQP